MTYIDGFVTPVLPGRDEEYAAFAREMAAILREHGALQMVEALSDDVPHGKQTDFWRAVAAADGERIAFSWIVWADRATRDAGMAKVMADARMRTDDVPFDMKRMIFGGFAVVVDA